MAYIQPMRKSAPRTPRNTVNVRRLPKEGDELLVKVRVTRVHQAEHAINDRITVEIPGFRVPVTAQASYLLGREDD
jgi:hypothetical protein